MFVIYVVGPITARVSEKQQVAKYNFGTILGSQISRPVQEESFTSYENKHVT